MDLTNFRPNKLGLGNLAFNNRLTLDDELIQRTVTNSVIVPELNVEMMWLLGLLNVATVQTKIPPPNPNNCWPYRGVEVPRVDASRRQAVHWCVSYGHGTHVYMPV